MTIFVSSQYIPIGYTRPSFPSLYLPFGGTNNSYQSLFLYYSKDIWIFTVAWSMLLFGCLYFAAGSLAVYNMLMTHHRHHRRVLKYTVLKCVVVFGLFILSGLCQAFFTSAIIGLILLTIYRTGSLSMSTWIPFCWGVALMLFNLSSSYLTSKMLL